MIKYICQHCGSYSVTPAVLLMYQCVNPACLKTTPTNGNGGKEPLLLNNIITAVLAFRGRFWGDTPPTVETTSIALQDACNDFLDSVGSNSVDSSHSLLNLMSASIAHWKSAFPQADKQELEDAASQLIESLAAKTPLTHHVDADGFVVKRWG